MLRWILKEYQALSVDELYAIMQLRQQIFVVEQNCPYLDADGKDKYAYHLWAYCGNEIVAYCRLLPSGISYPEVSIGRVVVHARSRTKGYGHLLMEQALSKIETLFGSVPIRIGAQSYLIAFYSTHGFQVEGDEYLEDGIPHRIMLRS